MSPHPAKSAPRPVLRRSPMLVSATLTWVGDRVGTALLDTGGSLDVRLPDVLWLTAGDRVKLYHYPDGWVAVLRYRPEPPPAWRGARR